jgi:uncharacterized membrane protein SpoIIM required for sporulation
MSLAQILFSPKKAKRHPLEMIAVGFFYTSLSMLISLWLIPAHASLTTIFLTVISSLYIVQGALIMEEKKEGRLVSEKWLLNRHAKIIGLFLNLFIGFLLAFMVWSTVLPKDTMHNIYALQNEEMSQLSAISGKAISRDTFSLIIVNNIKVLLVSIALALLYGAGALLVLAWNASMMGYVMGSLLKYEFGFSALPLVILKYILHGIPEMIAYFIGALIGGIVFVTLVKGDFSKDRIHRTVKDLAALATIAVTTLIIAAGIEVFISPLI